MSIKAHRIITIKLAETSSFQLWDNSKLMQYLEENDLYSRLNSSGTGQAEVSLDVLKKAVRMSTKLEIDENTLKQIQHDIKFASEKGDDFVAYECY